MRWACPAAGVAVIMLWRASAAPAAIVIEIGADQRSGGYGGCDPPGSTCTYVQGTWDHNRQVGIGPDSLPFVSSGAITHLHGQFYTAAGTVTAQVVRPAGDDPSSLSPIFDVVHAAGPLSLTGSGQLEADVHLHVEAEDTLAFVLAGGAQPFLDYEEGRSALGSGELYYTANDDGRQISGLKKPCNGGCNDGLVFRATVETDQDADGFGDETQDPCPGRAGNADGCRDAPPPTAPSPPATTSPRPHRAFALTKVTLRHRVLTYTVTRPRRVTARLDRRERHGWRLERRVHLPSTVGRHRVTLP